MKYFAVGLALVVISGCSTTPLNEIDYMAVAGKIDSVCVERNEKVIIEGFHEAIERSVIDKGISLRESGCDATITYTARRRFDFHAPLGSGDIKAISDGEVVGYVYLMKPANISREEYYNTPLEDLDIMMSRLLENQ